ncbi:TonB-dependent receptor, partial [Acinetobacter sp. NBRC 110496]|uniref:TonB-dependent receptor n=1 Tax=Acinetobacter sp. NBRC 110496 TaxID=1550715 RepID=UPI0005C61575
MSIAFQPTRLVGAIAIAMGFSSPAFAQDQSSDKTATLDTIVVTASRTEQKISDVPARINIIEPKILEQSPIASLPELLQTDASINMVQSGGYGQAASIFLRGTNSNHTLLLRDGVRLNSNTSGTASLPFIDTTDIKQIEVLKGPASVLYGADAIGGVVQLISKTPEKTSAFVTGEIGENKTYKSVIGADLAENGFYAQIRGQRLETDGTPVTDAKNNKKASFDQKGYSAKVGVDKAQYAASVDYSENQGYSDYDNYGNLVSQDFKNEAINVKGRLNVLENLAVHARLSQYKDNIDQNTSSDYVHSTTQEAELYTKWQVTPAQNILVGSTFKDIKGNVYSKNLFGGQDVD